MQKVDYPILICVTVVLVLISFFIFPNVETPSHNDEIFLAGCQELRQTCNQEEINNIVVQRNSTGNYTLGNICAQRGYVNSTSCAQSCGCTVDGTSTTLHSEPLKSYSDKPFGEGVFIVEGSQ